MVQLYNGSIKPMSRTLTRIVNSYIHIKKLQSYFNKDLLAFHLILFFVSPLLRLPSESDLAVCGHSLLDKTNNHKTIANSLT